MLFSILIAYYRVQLKINIFRRGKLKIEKKLDLFTNFSPQYSRTKSFVPSSKVLVGVLQKVWVSRLP